jgi:hypothetical protein
MSKFNPLINALTGNVVLNTIDLPTVEPNGPYYEIGSTVGDRKTSSAGKQLVFNESGYIYILQENDERITIVQGSLSTGNLYFPDGVAGGGGWW